MSKLGRLGTAVSLILLGAAAGAVAAFVHFVPPLLEGSERTHLLWVQSEAYARYRFGQYASAKRALLMHAQLAEAVARQAEPNRRRLLISESGMAYARLAVLAERSAQPEDREDFYSKSLAQYASLGDSPSRDALRDVVTSYDRDWNADFRDGH